MLESDHFVLEKETIKDLMELKTQVLEKVKTAGSPVSFKDLHEINPKKRNFINSAIFILMDEGRLRWPNRKELDNLRSEDKTTMAVVFSQDELQPVPEDPREQRIYGELSVFA